MEIQTFGLGPLRTNCYVVSDAGEAVLIDAGAFSEEVVSYLKEQQLTLKRILLTHAHFDHILGATAFAQHFGVPIAIGKKDEPALSDPQFNGAAQFGIQGVPPIKADEMLSEGDEIAVGSLTLRVIETPGHTKGGVSYYTSGYLFCGDTLFQESLGRTDLPGGSYEQIVASIKDKLYALPDETKVYPGHGPTTTIGYEKQNNFYVHP